MGLLLAAGATAVVVASCASSPVVNTPYDEAIWSLAVGADGSAIVGTEHGVYRTADDGRSWETLYHKDDIQPITALRTDDQDKALLAGTLDGRVVVICLPVQGAPSCPPPAVARITDYPITSIAAVSLAWSVSDRLKNVATLTVTATATTLGDGAFHLRYPMPDGMAATRLDDWDVADAWHDKELWCAMERQPQPLSLGVQGDMAFQGFSGMEFVGRRGTYYQFEPANTIRNLPSWAVGPKLVSLVFRHYPGATECAATGDGTAFVKDMYGRFLVVAGGTPQSVYANADGVPVPVYALGAGPGGHVAMATDRGIYVSDNDGESWRSVARPPSTEDRSAAAVALGWILPAAYAGDYGVAVDIAAQVHPIKIDTSLTDWKGYDTSQDVVHAFSTGEENVAKVEYQSTTPSVAVNRSPGQTLKFTTTFSRESTTFSPVTSGVKRSSPVLAGPAPSGGPVPGKGTGNPSGGTPTGYGGGDNGGGYGVGGGGGSTGMGGANGTGGGPPPPITVRFAPVLPGCEFTTTGDNIKCEQQYVDDVQRTGEVASDIEYIYEQWAIADFTGVYQDAEMLAADRLFRESHKLADEMAWAAYQRKLQEMDAAADLAAKEARMAASQKAIQDTRRLLTDIDDEITTDHARRNSSSSSVTTTSWHPSAEQSSNESASTQAAQPASVNTGHSFSDNGPAMQSLREAATRGFASGCVFDHSKCHN